MYLRKVSRLFIKKKGLKTNRKDVLLAVEQKSSKEAAAVMVAVDAAVVATVA